MKNEQNSFDKNILRRHLKIIKKKKKRKEAIKLRETTMNEELKSYLSNIW